MKVIQTLILSLLWSSCLAGSPSEQWVGTWLLTQTEAPKDREGLLNNLQMQLTVYSGDIVNIISLNKRDDILRAESDSGTIDGNWISFASGPRFHVTLRNNRLILKVDTPDARFIYRRIDIADISTYSAIGTWVYTPSAGNWGGLLFSLKPDGSGTMGVNSPNGLPIQWSDDGDTVTIKSSSDALRNEHNARSDQREMMLTKTALPNVMTLETQDERERLFLVREIEQEDPSPR